MHKLIQFVQDTNADVGALLALGNIEPLYWWVWVSCLPQPTSGTDIGAVSE